MKVFLDEGVSPAIAAPLRVVFPTDSFIHVNEEGLASTKDVPLFQEMRLRGADVFVTLDREQLRDLIERASVKAAGFHWMAIRHTAGSGRTLLARQSAALLCAIAYLIDAPPEGPTAFSVKGVGRQPGQIFGREVLLSRL